jgi:hypothetical protein
MLSIFDCQKHLKGLNYSPKQVETIRNFLYKIITDQIQEELNKDLNGKSKSKKITSFNLL